MDHPTNLKSKFTDMYNVARKEERWGGFPVTANFMNLEGTSNII